MQLNGASLINRFLERSGTRFIFGRADGPFDALVAALATSTLTVVTTGAARTDALAAAGLARMQHRAAICIAGSSTTFLEQLGVLGYAAADGVPLLMIVPRSTICRTTTTGPSPGRVAEHVTRAQLEARDLDDLLTLLPEALRIAEAGRPGPVVLEVSADALIEQRWLSSIPAPPVAPPPRATTTAAAPLCFEHGTDPAPLLRTLGITQDRATLLSCERAVDDFALATALGAALAGPRHRGALCATTPECLLRGGGTLRALSRLQLSVTVLVTASDTADIDLEALGRVCGITCSADLPASAGPRLVPWSPRAPQRRITRHTVVPAFTTAPGSWLRAAGSV